MTAVSSILHIIIISSFSIKKVYLASEFDFESSDFSQIVTTPAFVDKTLFIKAVIENNKTLLITAPPGFGKSTNMNMLKRFLEIEVDESGTPKTKTDYLKDQVKDTKNFKLFHDNMLKILDETGIVRDHFGRTPVLSVSFKCERTITNFDDAVEFVKRVVHKSFKQHRYLGRSVKLGADQKQYIDMWCDNRTYHMFGKHRVTSGLRELSEFLYRHFNDKTVFVLIDDHDSVFKRAMFNVTDDDQLDDIIRLTVCVINSLLKNNRRHVHGGLVTGTSDIPVFGSYLKNLEDRDAFMKCRFLDDHPFVDFFGLTKDEVNGLLVYPELKLGESVVDRARVMYGGFNSKTGKEIINLYSILNFLKTGEIRNYWKHFNYLPNFYEVLKVPTIKKSIAKIILGEPINIKVLEKLTLDDITDFRDLIIEPESQAVPVAIKYFSFLLEEGYLTYASKQEDSQHKGNENIVVRIPNDEIKEILTEALK